MNRKKKGKKARVILIVVVVVLAGAAGGFIAFPQLRGILGGEEAGSATYRVRSETYTNSIEIAGTIAAAKEQQLQAAGAGTVTAVYVREGDRVAKGQVILRLDDSEQRYNLEKLDFDMAQKRVSGSPREIELLAQQREVLEQRLKDRQVIANFDGVIAQFSIAVGDVVEAKDSAGVILDRSYLKATVEVVETDAPKLRSGQKVTLNFPALAAAGQDTVIEGRVYSFPSVATKSSRGASVVKAEIRIDDPPDVILPNYSFTGEIEISPPETMLLVERLAIGYERPAEMGNAPAGPDNRGNERGTAPVTPGNENNTPGNRPRLGAAFAEKILPDGGLARVAVQVVPYGEEFVKVMSGLAEGDEVKAQGVAPRSGQSGTVTNTGNRQQNQTPGMPMIRIGGPGGG
ncbi:MAG: HlyD family efflux transporter periplasmic adaptor subunit [Spirochaetaceae bacterium]|nr:HlyD family efflux transporter periplasmic adaptor subunit [Spirochaetaceae bacterium]